MAISTQPLPGTTIDPRYPDSDDEPLAETDLHLLAIIYLHGALRYFFRDRDDAGVWADLFLYYKEGNGEKRKAPDVMVAFGVVGKHPRRSFRTWEEGVVPAVIFEITSKKTCHEDEHGKKETYQQLGVKEYYLFDPEDRSIRPRLQGFRLHEGRYVALAPDDAGRLISQQLGMLLVVDDPLLRLIDVKTGECLMSFDEAIDGLDEAKQSMRQARQQAEQALQQADQARQQADQSRQLAEKAQKQAERAGIESAAQRQHIADLEAELARLRAAQASDQ
ncbi:MAG TPA: Uma2 family endonuclease [Pirellulales bacterium]|nr:Uma2 family endonuclease [Pirellulales bacterium]